MKAIVIGRKLSANFNDFNHRGGTYVRSLVVEESGGLCIHLVEDKIYAFTGLNLDGKGYDLLDRVDVPDEIVAKALKIAKINEELNLAKAELMKDSQIIQKLVGE